VNSFLALSARCLSVCLFIWLSLGAYAQSSAGFSGEPGAGAEVLMEASSYKLGSGDVISIRVYGSSDLSFDSLRLTDAGTFSFPFLGEVRAAGKTTTELEATLIEGLKGGYFISPQVSVTLLEYRPFFVKGQVKSPGSYPYQPGLTLRKAITLAGGLTPLASSRRITIIRESNPEQKPERISPDGSVLPGDIIEIGQGLF
jgi:polysaccharide biosynthesis/export protein VpsN